MQKRFQEISLRSVLQTIVVCLFAVAMYSCSSNHVRTPDKDYTIYANPFTGTKGEGNTYPGAVLPFGMVQLSPDTGTEGWDWCSGYAYEDSSIIGFSHQHLSGAGCPDLGDILLMPSCGRMFIEPGTPSHPENGYRSGFSHSREVASPGYYAVNLIDNRVMVELTVTKRCGLHRYHFANDTVRWVIIDMKHVIRKARPTDQIIWSNLRIENDSTVTGYHLVSGWAPLRYVYFAAVFSAKISKKQIYRDKILVTNNQNRYQSQTDVSGKDIQGVLFFNTLPGDSLLVKVGISAVGCKNALDNIKAELKTWDFEKIRKYAHDEWNYQLSKIRIDEDTSLMKMFYTAMYHAAIAPSLFEDVNGEYRGIDQQVHKSDGFVNYSVLSLWDTFRALHPLLTLINLEQNMNIITSMLEHFNQNTDKLLPVWPLNGSETWCMIAYHAVPVIADAIVKNHGGFDYNKAMEAMITTAGNDKYHHLEMYRHLGYVPADLENESVSKTLELAYDDWCIAQAASTMGKGSNASGFISRGNSFYNIFDSTTKFFRAKLSNGQFREPFNAMKAAYWGDYTEGNAWQYLWFVPHDIPALVRLLGGKNAFASKLDSLFLLKPKPGDLDEVSDISGLTGLYAHGNEPSHHVPYLFDYAGQPWKTQDWLDRIFSSQYKPKPDGLTGNDDCGQMSAWYIFTALGFYPVCPASGYYVIGKPMVRHALVQLADGRNFCIDAPDLSPENRYIQKILLNGKTWNKLILLHRDIEQGGTLTFIMGPKPDTTWSISEKALIP